MQSDDYAREVIRAANDLKITPRGIVIGLATVLVEVGNPIRMYANHKVPESFNHPHDRVGNDGYSVGLFQQQIRQGVNGDWWWSDCADCMNPYKSARLFFSRLARLDYTNPTRSPGWYAQQVQKSAYPDRYDQRMADAQQLYDRLTEGPAMGWTGDPIWLADVLRAEGLNVIEHEGWRDRGHGDFRDIRGVLCHHTAGGGKNDWQIVQNGRSDLPGPLAQLVLEKDGTYRVIAAGVCWHAGRGSWAGWPTDNANHHTIGIEAVSRGTAPWDWTEAQLDAYKRGCAAILRRLGLHADRCVAHREYSSEGKIDPAGINMDHFRGDVQRIIDAGPSGKDELTMGDVKHLEDFIIGYVGPGLSDLKDVREQATGGRDGGEYPGFPQTAELTNTDALAVIGEVLGIPGFGLPADHPYKQAHPELKKLGQ